MITDCILYNVRRRKKGFLSTSFLPPNCQSFEASLKGKNLLSQEKDSLLFRTTSSSKEANKKS